MGNALRGRVNNSTASPTHSPAAFNGSWPSALLVSPTHTYTFPSCIFLQHFIMNIFRHTTTLKESYSEHSYTHHLDSASNGLLYLLHHMSVSLSTLFTHFFFFGRDLNFLTRDWTWVPALSSILAWRIPWREEPGRLQSTGLQRVGHNWASSLSLSSQQQAKEW